MSDKEHTKVSKLKRSDGRGKIIKTLNLEFKARGGFVEIGRGQIRVLRIRDEVLANCSANICSILLLFTLYIYMSCHPFYVYL